MNEALKQQWPERPPQVELDDQTTTVKRLEHYEATAVKGPTLGTTPKSSTRRDRTTGRDSDSTRTTFDANHEPPPKRLRSTLSTNWSGA